MPNCKQCNTGFEISEADRKFYAMMEVPAPTFCPECRFQRRLAFRNERTLYPDTCDLCKKHMISNFSPKSEYTVYCQKCWWSDGWDSFQYGSDFDFGRSFFDQFDDLLKKVPLCGLSNVYDSLENSEYVNYTSDAKNCYLMFATNFLEDCLYGSYIWESKDAVDCAYSTKLELCYSCLDSDQLYHCTYLQNSKNCSDCTLGYELRNCKNCFGCVNLKDKEFCFFNEQMTEGDYRKKVEGILSDRAKFDEAMKRFHEFSLKFPRKYVHQINCENTTGDGLKSCKNSYDCFDGYGGEDLKWMINFPGEVKDCYDISGCARFERGIECHAIFPGYNVRYTSMSFGGSDNETYCAYIRGGSDLFGCVGLKKSKYCVLNKQYSKQEYEQLVPRIIEHMTKKGATPDVGQEWGEFFPVTMSPFAYNESMAIELFPLSKEQVLEKGWKWSDYVAPFPDVVKVVSASQLPDRIDDIPDDILNWAIKSERSGKPFKITSQELRFYRKMKLPVPHLHPDERHADRLGQRNPRKLWDRDCAKCATVIRTTYSPDRPEIVYCEQCYLKEVY